MARLGNHMLASPVTLLLGLALQSTAAAAFFSSFAAPPSPSLQSRQYNDDGPPTPAVCVATSFTNPNHYILGPEIITINATKGGTYGDFGFLAYNTATGVNARCVGQDIDLDPPAGSSEWHSCNVTNLEWQFNLTSFVMRLRSKYTCPGYPFVFSSEGIWEEPVIQGCLDDETKRGAEILCIMGNSQVPAALSSPVAITPQLPLLPFTPDEPPYRCPDRSYDPEWVVEKFAYSHYPAGYNLSVDITNIATYETTSCSITVNKGNGIDAKGIAPWIKCPVTAKNGTYIKSTELYLEPDYGILGVRQAWSCNDTLPGVDLDEYTAAGYLASKLVCSTPTAPETYDCILAVPTETGQIRFSGYWPEPPSMPHTRYSPSCTIESFANLTSFALKEYQIEDASSSLVGTFSLANPATGDTYRLEKISVVDDGAWHDCVASVSAGTPQLPWQLSGCRYSLDRKARKIGFQVGWFCDDRDPSHPVLFDAVVGKELPAEECVASAGGKSCRLPAALGDVVLPVSNLTWKSTDKPMDRGPILPWI